MVGLRLDPAAGRPIEPSYETSLREVKLPPVPVTSCSSVKVYFSRCAGLRSAGAPSSSSPKSSTALQLLIERASIAIATPAAL